MHALNVFQSSATFSGDFITTGTILKRMSGRHPEWLVVVEPACNLVPSQGQEKAAFTSCRMLELVKLPVEHIADVLNDAVHGRHLFVQMGVHRLYFSIGKVNASLQPIIVDSFVPRTAQFRDDGAKLTIDVHFTDLCQATLTSSKSEYQIVSQLHEPYANRLLHAIGAHLSRIGLDFVSFPKPQQQGEQSQ
jgi:hypothetical protein